MTKKLYKENVYQKEAAACITGISTQNDYALITLDQTIFFPTGGGQSCDRGTINATQVIDVYEEDGEIYHKVAASGLNLTAGDAAVLTLDWDHRFDNMQRHCGEHILSGMFHREFGGVNRGFHMGEEYMTIDISLEDNPDFTEITWDMSKQVELCTNQAIWANLPVITRHYDTREKAAGLPLRKTLAFDEDITIVSVGDINNPSDCVACCGTHPSTSGQIGLVKLYKVEKNKGMFRVYFEAGQRAFKQYQDRFDVLTTLENKLSAGFEDIMQKYDAQQDKNKAVRNQLYHLKKSVISSETDAIASELSQGSGDFLTKKYDTLSIDDLLDIGRALTSSISKVLYLLHSPSNTLLLFSKGEGKFDCGKLVKENASIYNGKGGGNKNSARAIFPKAEYIDTFIELLEKHLR